MGVRKGFKQTEVGVIPEDWGVATIGSFADTSSGTTPSRALEERYYKNGDIAWVKTLDLNNSEIYLTDECVTQTAINETSLKIYPEGSVLVAMYGGFNQIGRTGLLCLPATINQALTAIKPNAKFFSSQYLLRYLNYRVMYWRYVASSSRKDPNITGKDVRDFPVALPPTLAEQEAIAEALSDADALIESLETLLAKKHQVKQGAMSELLTGKRRLVESGEWEVKSLLELAEGKKELFDDGDWIESEHITNEGIRLIQTGNIGVGKFLEREDKKYIYPSSFVSLRCKELREGDLLVCRLAEPAGRACILPNIGEEKVITSVDVTIFRPPASLANRVFLANVFSTNQWFRSVNDRSGGTTHKRISRGALGRMKIILPSIAEQTAIAEILSDMDAEIRALEEKLSKARGVKAGMMSALLTGRVRLV